VDTADREELPWRHGVSVRARHGVHHYVADRAVIEKQFRLRLRRLLKFVTDARKKNLFEIGCAHGFFLGVARLLVRALGHGELLGYVCLRRRIPSIRWRV
jgi:hypothetical protein